ncbi:response regulator [Tsuneonella sp. HG249]
MNLAFEVESIHGVVVGPTATVAQALTLLSDTDVAGAILDANLADRDITPVAVLLWERGIPFVLHSGKGIPAELAEIVPGLKFIAKPEPAAAVVECLLKQLR